MKSFKTTNIDNKLHLEFPEDNEGKFNPICIDFVGGKLNHMRKFSISKKQLFSKAVGALKGVETALDLTAGLGRDTFFLACLGIRVTALERNAAVYSLLEDAYKRAIAASEGKEHLTKIFDRMKFINEDSFEYLSALEETPDLIYLDPMFPESKKSSKSKKEMVLLKQMLESNEEESRKLLELALKKAGKRVVIKRPSEAKELIENVSFKYEGKSIRYDMYSIT